MKLEVVKTPSVSLPLVSAYGDRSGREQVAMLRLAMFFPREKTSTSLIMIQP